MGTTVKIGTLTGQYVETPAQSGFFTFPEDAHTEDPAGSGLFTPGSLVESSEGLFDVPALTFSSFEYIRGGPSNLTSWSVQEDATTIDPSNFNGGAGQVVVNALEGANSLLAMDKQLFLENAQSGTVQTTVREVQISDGSLTLTADSPLGLFNSHHTVMPHIGTLQSAMSYYLGLVGVTASLSVDPSIASRPVTYPGWVGNVWDNIKQILSAEQIEMTCILGSVFVQPLRGSVSSLRRGTSLSKSLNKQQVAEQVEIYWYNNTAINKGEVYPVPSEKEAPSPATVEASATTRFTVQLNASLSSVNQPECIDYVLNKNYSGTDGVYSVIANDNLPVPTAQWLGNGGSLSVRITDDPSVIEVTVVGMRNSGAAQGPFRIAMSSGNAYNSLHITGQGVSWRAESTVLYTGATGVVTGEKVGVTVENRFISSYNQALNAGQNTAKAYARTHTSSGDVVSFDNQVFGTAVGSVIKTPDANYRIDSIDVSENGTNFSATEDTTMSDFAAAWAGLPPEAFANYWTNKSALDFATTPLRTP